VYADGRVLVKTAPNGHTIPGANGHGYSIWAPLPSGVSFTTVSDMYNYLATYSPQRSTSTTQEWEMDDDLGDSHCSSLGQGGKLPDNSMNERIAGKIYSGSNTTITCAVYPEIDGRDLTVSLYDASGEMVATVSGVTTASSPLVLSYMPVEEGWIKAKVRNTAATYPGQKCWVNITYTAPAAVNTRSGPGKMQKNISVWSGNKNTTEMFDCGNWEEGAIPNSTSTIIVFGHTRPFPVLTYNLTVSHVIIESNAKLTVSPGVTLTVN
jgi:hypothetical protein